jgi:hypothetical protein
MKPTRRKLVQMAAATAAAAALPAALEAQAKDPTAVLLPLAEKTEQSPETSQLMLALPNEQMALLEGDQVSLLTQRSAGDGVYPMKQSGSLLIRGGMLIDVQGLPAGNIIADEFP